MTQLKAVFWDVDGTLADTDMDGHRPAFNRAFKDLDLNIVWDQALYARLLAIPGGLQRVRLYAESCGIPLSANQLEAIRDRKRIHYTELAQSGAIRFRPGIRRLLALLQEAGIQQWIVTSSGSASVEALLSSAQDVMPIFRGMVTAEDVDQGKPSPQGYQLALKTSGCTASNCLAVEDSEAGLDAARSAGLRCLLTPSPWDLNLSQRHDDAVAVFDHVGDSAHPARCFSGPPCEDGLVTLEYLKALLSLPG